MSAIYTQLYSVSWNTVAQSTWGDIGSKIWGEKATFKTNWLPIDTYDVKVDFTRIFQNAISIAARAQEKQSTFWDGLTQWDEAYSASYGTALSTPNTALKLSWDYSDMIYKSYFSALIGELNYIAYHLWGEDETRLIPVGGIKFTSQLLNKIELLERDLYYDVHGKL